MGIRPLPIVFATLLIITTFPYSAAAEVPHANAGLDQTVTKGATVQLDATGSRDPDGTIESYQWEILGPEGDPVAPECTSCGQTTFRADVVGTYEVTTTVTDDDGDTASDTLYVDVEPGAPPTLVLTGPSKLQTGQTGTYVAEAESGDANLQRIVWLVNGNPVDTQSVSGDTASSTLDQQFPTASTHHVTARIVDADDQTAIQTVTTSVDTPPSNPGNQQSPWPGDGTSGNRGTATVSGPQLLTGAEPLRGTYTLRGSHIDSVIWWKNGMKVGTGTEYTTEFSSGDHRLHAEVMYTDGSTGIGRFGDSTTRVVADPKPSIDLNDLDGIGGLSIDSTASDGYGNLQRFEIRLYGETVLSRETNQFNLQKDDEGHTLELSAQRLEVEQGTYEAELVAADGRGQVTRQYETLEVVGPPDVVRSEFVEKDDLDVYHPRIDPERYTAKHVLVIELNGIEPDTIDIHRIPDPWVIPIENYECGSGERTKAGKLIITTCWGSEDLQTGTLRTFVRWNQKNQPIGYTKTQLEPTDSKPEPVIRVISGGATAFVKNRGLVIDASQSFDPDGYPLTFRWTGEADAVNMNGSIGKFAHLQENGLTIIDAHKNEITIENGFVGYFNPEIGDIRIATKGPILIDDYVEFRIRTRAYELTQNNLRRMVDLRLEPSDGQVLNHSVYYGQHAGETGPKNLPLEESSAYNYQQEFWTVRVPARAFLDGNPTFDTYNTNQKEDTLDTYSFPEPRVLVPGRAYVKDSKVTREYVIRVPTFTRISTVYEGVKADLESRGYNTIRAEETGKEWEFERQEKISDSVYETDSRGFLTSGERSVYLQLNPSWTANGSKTVTSEVTRTSSEWRDSKRGSGEFTGETRQQKVRTAEYRTERKYRFQYTDTETRTRTVTYTYQYQITREYQTTVTQCNRYVGCYERTVTKTRDVTRTATREYTKSYQYRVTKTATYWSTGKRDSSHTYTGDSRVIQTRAPVYETQYKFLVERTEEITKQVFLASKTQLIQPARYEWRSFKATRSKLVAKELELQNGIRLASVNPVTEWTLRKQTGSKLEIRATYEDESDVIETRVNVSGTIVQPHFDPETGQVVVRNETESQYEYKSDEFEDKDEAIRKFIERWLGGEVK